LAIKIFEHCRKKFDQNVLGNEQKNSIVGLMAIVNRTINVYLFRRIQMGGCNFGVSCWF
jgi:hypothetical protein